MNFWYQVACMYMQCLNHVHHITLTFMCRRYDQIRNTCTCTHKGIIHDNILYTIMHEYCILVCKSHLLFNLLQYSSVKYMYEVGKKYYLVHVYLMEY